MTPHSPCPCLTDRGSSSDTRPQGPQSLVGETVEGPRNSHTALCFWSPWCHPQRTRDSHTHGLFPSISDPEPKAGSPLCLPWASVTTNRYTDTHTLYTTHTCTHTHYTPHGHTHNTTHTTHPPHKHTYHTHTVPPEVISAPPLGSLPTQHCHQCSL